MNIIAVKKREFLPIVSLIQAAKEKAFLAVNTGLIDLYWDIGAHISKKVRSAHWGESVVKDLARFIAEKYPELKGYSDKNLWRMRQFYEAYHNQPKLSPLVRQISWTHNMMIMAKAKSWEEREFYLRISVKERYSKRELERQIASGSYERYMLSHKKVSSMQRPLKKEILDSFKDTYILDFLELPKGHSEKDLQEALMENFKNFVLEFGKDFTFVGKEYRIQVGNNDYFIDLLFYHRALQCLVAFELKTGEFQPEYMGKLNFYLEALDRDVKKKHENPSVGVILCKSKDDEVVEYALSRNLSPSLIAEYKTKLIKKRILKKKLHELYLSSNYSD